MLAGALLALSGCPEPELRAPCAEPGECPDASVGDVMDAGVADADADASAPNPFAIQGVLLLLQPMMEATGSDVSWRTPEVVPLDGGSARLVPGGKRFWAEVRNMGVYPSGPSPYPTYAYDLEPFRTYSIQLGGSGGYQLRQVLVQVGPTDPAYKLGQIPMSRGIRLGPSSATRVRGRLKVDPSFPTPAISPDLGAMVLATGGHWIVLRRDPSQPVGLSRHVIGPGRTPLSAPVLTPDGANAFVETDEGVVVADLATGSVLPSDVDIPLELPRRFAAPGVPRAATTHAETGEVVVLDWSGGRLKQIATAQPYRFGDDYRLTADGNRLVQLTSTPMGRDVVRTDLDSGAQVNLATEAPLEGNLATSQNGDVVYVSQVLMRPEHIANGTLLPNSLDPTCAGAEGCRVWMLRAGEEPAEIARKVTAAAVSQSSGTLLIEQREGTGHSLARHVVDAATGALTATTLDVGVAYSKLALAGPEAVVIALKTGVGLIPIDADGTGATPFLWTSVEAWMPFLRFDGTLLLFGQALSNLFDLTVLAPDGRQLSEHEGKRTDVYALPFGSRGTLRAIIAERKQRDDAPYQRWELYEQGASNLRLGDVSGWVEGVFPIHHNPVAWRAPCLLYQAHEGRKPDYTTGSRLYCVARWEE